MAVIVTGDIFNKVVPGNFLRYPATSLVILGVYLKERENYWPVHGLPITIDIE